ncbi:unnamed protein product, partial [Meganyctiphanes norvegica]
ISPIKKSIDKKLLFMGRTYIIPYVFISPSMAPKAAKIYYNKGDHTDKKFDELSEKHANELLVHLGKISNLEKDVLEKNEMMITLENSLRESNTSIVELQKDNTEMLYQQDALSQYNRRDSIKLFGIPHDKEEDINKIVKDVAKHLGVELEDKDISNNELYEAKRILCTNTCTKYSNLAIYEDITPLRNRILYNLRHKKDSVDNKKFNWDSQRKKSTKFRHSGWWYKSCTYANLNGRYYLSADSDNGTGPSDSMYWYDFRGFDSLKSSTMMIRPHPYTSANLTEPSHQDQDDISNSKQYLMF